MSHYRLEVGARHTPYNRQTEQVLSSHQICYYSKLRIPTVEDAAAATCFKPKVAADEYDMVAAVGSTSQTNLAQP